MTTAALTLEGLSAGLDALREGQTRLEAAIIETNRLIAESNREVNRRIDETNRRIDNLFIAVIVIGGGLFGVAAGAAITMAVKLFG